MDLKYFFKKSLEWGVGANGEEGKIISFGDCIRDLWRRKTYETVMKRQMRSPRKHKQFRFQTFTTLVLVGLCKKVHKSWFKFTSWFRGGRGFDFGWMLIKTFLISNLKLRKQTKLTKIEKPRHRAVKTNRNTRLKTLWKWTIWKWTKIIKIEVQAFWNDSFVKEIDSITVFE